MKSKTAKKKNSGGRHRPLVVEVDHFGAPPVPMDVLVTEGVFAPAAPATLPVSVPAPPALAPLLLTAEQACTLLGVSRAHFFRLKKAGNVPGCVNLGGLVRYRREDLEAWVKQLQPSP